MNYTLGILLSSCVCCLRQLPHPFSGSVQSTYTPFTRSSKRRADIEQTSSRPDGTPLRAQM